MQKLVRNVLKLGLIGVVTIGTAAFAEKMDESTHSLVIDKFERALDLMDKSAPERSGIELRLADLYADRARLKGMDEAQKSCDNCDGSKADRIKALSYYQASFPSIKGDEQGKILVQMAHLNNLDGDSDKAEKIYRNVIKKGKPTFTSAVVGASYFNVGEIYFRAGQFGKAQQNYEKARKEDIPNAAFIEYRQAWCEFNLGHPEKAIQSLVKILSKPGFSPDPTFNEDVSHDLATFYGHSEVGAQEIAQLRTLSPEKTRRANLYLLATETERLGKKSSALMVWTAYVNEGEVKGAEKIEIQIRVAQDEYDLGRLPQAIDDYSKAIALWKSQSCTEQDKCGELKIRLRGFVLSWNKALKSKPTTQLLQVYLAYLNAFPDDAEMTQWAALVARDVKQYRDAVALFRKSALIAKNSKTAAKVLEGSLLGEIEMAEASKDLKLREDAYTFYIDTAPQGEKAFEARFERANVWYQQGKYTQAYSEFHYLATAPGPLHHDIKLKSADLALDTLVLLKDDKSLEVRSQEYARAFPERQKEYAEIARKAALNQIASSLSNKSLDRSVYVASLAKLKTVNLAGASDQDKIKYWKNRITVAMQAKDLGEVKAGAEGLLGCQKLSSNDQEFGIAQLEWVAELQLDFKEAYRHAKRLKYVQLTPADRDLRLAFLAELAGEDAGPHYEKYLHDEKNLRSRNLTRVTLVTKSMHPWRELNRHLAELKRTPDLLAPLALEVFGRERNLNEAKHILAKTSIGNTSQGRLIMHQIEFGSIDAFRRKIGSHRLNASSDASLQRSLKERLSLLNEAGKRLHNFSRQHDWSMEVASLELLAKENQRLGNDLLRLPAPRKLNAQQKQQYHNLLQQKANTFINQAAIFEHQWENKWNGNTFAEMEKNFQEASPDTQNVLRVEIEFLANNAPADAKTRLYSILSEKRSRPSHRQILSARYDLQRDPFNSEKLETLRNLEKQAGQTTMVSYLDARINQMKKGQSL